MRGWYGAALVLAEALGAGAGEPFPDAARVDELESAAAEAQTPQRLALRWRMQSAALAPRSGRIYQRLEWRGGDWGFYALSEKDPGEGNWMDFAAFYIRWRPAAGPLEVVAGDVRPGFGQGLVLARSGRRGGLPLVQLRDDSEGLGYRASAENRTLRGAVLRYRRRSWSAVLLLGRDGRDARFDAAGRVVSLPQSGLHLGGGRRVLGAWTGGVRLRLVHGRLRGGTSLLGIHFGHQVDLRRAGKTPWDFHGRRQGLMGLDMQWRGKTLRGAFEAAGAGTGRRGALALAQVALGRARLGALVRSYGPGFHSFYGGALSAGGGQNERGYLLTLDLRQGGRRWRFFIDQFRPLQPLFSDPLPGTHQVWGAQVEQRLHKRWRVRAAYQHRRKPRRRGGEAGLEESRRGRAELGYEAGRALQLRVRLEGRLQSEGEKGRLAALSGRGEWKAARYTLHLSHFATHSYATRIYEFEYDLPGVVSIRPLYGRGWRFYALLGWRGHGWEWSGRYRLQHTGAGVQRRFGLQLDFEMGKTPGRRPIRGAPF